MKNTRNALVLSLLLSLFVVAPVTVFAQQGEFTDPAAVLKDDKLSRDFKIQGEYVGEFDDDDCGVNIIAEGNGKFRFVVFEDGLPGDGWKRGEDRIFCEASLDDQGNLVVTPKEEEDDGKRKKIENSKTIVFKVEDGKLHADKDNTLKKVVRKSPTLGAEAPKGAVVLFADGKMNGDMWENGKVNEEAKTLWAEAATKPFEKKPYKMHVEFLVSYMPEARGQGRANSGVYIDEAYECQVLDSFGLEGENNECGGFYTVAKPNVNMCFPPLQWQTYDIELTPAKFDADGKKTAKAKISVKHNGVVIHDGIEPDKETPGRKKEEAGARGLYLQGHGNKVQYRNIWIEYQ